MKLLVLLACAVLVGCGVIFGLVHYTVPHLVSPTLLPSAGAREPAAAPIEGAIARAGGAVCAGAGRPADALVADRR